MGRTSGGPDLRDCMAQPSNCSSRSVNLGAAAVVPGEGVLVLSDIVVGSRVKSELKGSREDVVDLKVVSCINRR